MESMINVRTIMHVIKGISIDERRMMQTMMEILKKVWVVIL